MIINKDYLVNEMNNFEDVQQEVINLVNNVKIFKEIVVDQEGYLNVQKGFINFLIGINYEEIILQHYVVNHLSLQNVKENLIEVVFIVEVNVINIIKVVKNMIIQGIVVVMLVKVVVNFVIIVIQVNI